MPNKTNELHTELAALFFPENALITAELQSAESYADAALAPNTRKTYLSAFTKYEKWCKSRGFELFGPRGQVAIYLAFLADSGLKVSTVSMALCSISKAYQAQGLPCPREDRAVKLVFQGIRNTVGISPEQVEAILPHHLRAMVDALPTGDGTAPLRSLRNRALLTLGWVGGMRRSEIVALKIADVQQVPEGLKVTIRRSKTDQEGRGRVIALPYSTYLETCPVRSLAAWLAAAEITEGFIFRSISPGGVRLRDYALSDRQLANVVKRAASDAGVEGRFAGHSLRSGLVTSAIRAGKDVSSVQAVTGHKTTEMLYRYVREQALFKNPPSAGLV